MPVSRPALREALFQDYARVAALQARNGLTTMPCEHWVAVWDRSPVYRSSRVAWPIGWVLETGAGEIVGFIANIPVAYRFRGRDLRASVTGSWVTDPAYRGYSLLLLNAVMKQSEVDLFITNTANARSDATLRLLDWSRVPTGGWNRCHFWITDPGAFTRWVLESKRLPGLFSPPLSLALRAANRWTARRLRASQAVEACPTFDARFDQFWNELEGAGREVLLAVRDRQTLLWHFHRSMKRETARIFTLNRGSRMIAYAVFDRRDVLSLTRIRLVDFQALEDAGPALAAFLSTMLQEAAAAGVHVLESTGHPLRALGDPNRVAPYRRTLDAWRYYYRPTTDELRQTLTAPAVWSPSYYDGDASL